MKKSAKLSSAGFTVIELVVFIAISMIVAFAVITNVRSIRAENRDQERKTDINSLFYQLEAFYETNNYYPEQLTEKTLPGVNPDVLKDSNDLSINQAGSEYTYSPEDCKASKCASYELEATLEREINFVKTSLNS